MCHVFVSAAFSFQEDVFSHLNRSVMRFALLEKDQKRKQNGVHTGYAHERRGEADIKVASSSSSLGRFLIIA